MRSETLCFCGSGRPHADCHPELHPDSLVAELYRLMQAVDEEIVGQKRQKLLSSPCGPGCCECCSRCFCVSETEFALILHHLIRNPPPERLQAVIDKSHHQWELLREHSPKIAEKLGGVVALKELMRLGDLSLPFPCVFLDKSGRCSIYPVRPLQCRLHGEAYANFLLGTGGRPCSKIPGGMVPAETDCNNPPDGSIDCMNPEDFVDLTDYSSRLLGFILLRKDSLLLIRRPAPLFYYFHMVFGDQEPGAEVDEPLFCKDMLRQSEEEYLERLATTIGR